MTIELSFQFLSHKLVMADRCSDMAALNLTYWSYQGSRVKFIIPGLTKTRRSGPPTEAFYPTFAAVPKLCPVLTLQCYERRSEKLCTNSNSTPQKALFFSVWRFHKPVKPATIGYWLKRLLALTQTVFPHIPLVVHLHQSQGSGSSYGRHFEGSQLEFHLHVLPFLPQANWLSQIWMWCPRGKVVSSIKVESFDQYHVVNWLCCRSVSGSSEVQFQILQGLSTICRGGWIVWGDEGYTETT